MKKDNVIQFPNTSKRTVETTTENLEREASTGVALVKASHINDTLAAVVPMLFNNIELAGFNLDIDDEQGFNAVKDGSLVVEAIKSLLCKHYGIYHPFQDISQAIFKFNGDTEIELIENISVNISVDSNSTTVNINTDEVIKPTE